MQLSAADSRIRSKIERNIFYIIKITGVRPKNGKSSIIIGIAGRYFYHNASMVKVR